MNRRAVLAGTLGLATTAGGLLLRGSGRSDAAIRDAPLPERSGTVAGFLAGIGVCTHLTVRSSSYADVGRAVAQLRELGVHHVRDDVRGDPSYLSQLLKALSAARIKATLIVNPRTFPLTDDTLRWLRANRYALDAVEGPNEIDNTHAPMAWTLQGRPLYTSTIAYQRDLYRFVKGAGPELDVLGFTTTRPEFSTELTAMLAAERAPLYDLESVHAYDTVANGTAGYMNWTISNLRHDRARPFAVTETGYPTMPWSPMNSRRGGGQGVTERIQAIYLLRSLLETYALGAQRTFVYELQDQGTDTEQIDKEAHFGLYTYDGRPKPAARLLASFLRTLRDADGRGRTAGAPQAQRPIVQAPPGVATLWLKTADGDEVLILWRTGTLWDRGTHSESQRGDAVQVALRWPASDSRGRTAIDMISNERHELQRASMLSLTTSSVVVVRPGGADR